MLDQEVIDELRYQLQKKVIAHEVFTAYDLTELLRAQGIRCYHSDVKEVVHNTFLAGEMAGYNRRLADYGGTVEAWEYYYDRPDASISTHRAPSATARDYSTIQNRVQDLYQLGLKTQDDIDQALGVVHTSGYVQAVDIPSDMNKTASCSCSMVPVADDTDCMVARADKRATVCVPADAVRQLGLRPGWVALVIPCRQECLVRIENPSTRALAQIGIPQGARQYIVDDHYNVRITKGVFAEAYCFGTKFKVTVNHDDIVLESL